MVVKEESKKHPKAKERYASIISLEDSSASSDNTVCAYKPLAEENARRLRRALTARLGHRSYPHYPHRRGYRLWCVLYAEQQLARGADGNWWRR